LLERWPRWGGVGNLFATAAVGNDAQRKKGQDRSDVHAPFLADHQLRGLIVTAIPSAFIMEAA
jgi:hypothetical protein